MFTDKLSKMVPRSEKFLLLVQTNLRDIKGST